MERTAWPFILLAVCAGALGGIHVPINGALGDRINSTFVATFAFYGVAFALISAVVLVTREREAFAALWNAPKWYFIAGVISVLVVGASTFLIPRIGAFNLFAIFVTSQLLVRVVISHYGWFSSPVQPLNLGRLAGAVLLLAGALLVVRN